MDILKYNVQAKDDLYTHSARTYTHTSFPQFYFRNLHDWDFSQDAEYLSRRAFYYNHNTVYNITFYIRKGTQFVGHLESLLLTFQACLLS